MAWTLAVEDWTPPSVNQLWKKHWTHGHRLKREAGERVRFAQLTNAVRVPQASRKRRIGVVVTVSGRGGLPDPDNVLKILFDALKANGLLVDDSGPWCEIGNVTVERGPVRRTVVVIEDVGP